MHQTRPSDRGGRCRVHSDETDFGGCIGNAAKAEVIRSMMIGGLRLEEMVWKYFVVVSKSSKALNTLPIAMYDFTVWFKSFGYWVCLQLMVQFSACSRKKARAQTYIRRNPCPQIKNRWLRQEQQAGRINNVVWIPSNRMIADGLKKPLPRQKFEKFGRSRNGEFERIAWEKWCYNI